MKTIPQMLKCFAAAMIFMSVTQAYAAGLISLHRFNETDTSQPAADSSGNGLNGTYQGGVTLSTGSSTVISTITITALPAFGVTVTVPL